MALVLNLNVMLVVLFGAVIVTCGFLIVSIVMACFNSSRAYGWLRCSICAAGAICSPVMSFFLYMVASLWKGGQPLAGSELRELRIGMAILAIPMIVGLLAAVGTKNRLTRTMGNILVFGIPPVVLLLVIAGEPGGAIKALTPWVCAATVTSMFAWRALLVASNESARPARGPVRFNDA